MKRTGDGDRPSTKRITPGETRPIASHRAHPRSRNTPTMAAVFNKAGYDTMRTCKKGNSYEAANQKFTVRKDRTNRGGTAESGSAWHAEQVLAYLQTRKANKDKDPFLIYFGFSHPHDPRNGTPDLLKKYGATNSVTSKALPPLNDKQPPLPVNYLPAHPFHHGERRRLP